MFSWFSVCVLSGFASLLYQVVWTRKALGMFGATTPVYSVVISVFMAGFALGSWGIARFARSSAAKRSGQSARANANRWTLLYAAVELGIGIGGLSIPALMSYASALLPAGAGSTEYLAASAIALTVCLLPFTILMGTTLPLIMLHLEERLMSSEPALGGRESARSFSYLYLANVLGAALGVLGSALVLIELVGLSATLACGAIANVCAAAIAYSKVERQILGADPRFARETDQAAAGRSDGPGESGDGRMTVPILFATGLCSMAMEVIWIRLFTPLYGPFAYSFASILAFYLVGTMYGCVKYRHGTKAPGSGVSRGTLLLLAAVTSLLPALATSLHLGALRASALVSILPFCALLGYLTPQLVDGAARGDGAIAGRLYAVNMIGCIIGPLVAAYLLLPRMNEVLALALLALPLWIFGVRLRRNTALAVAFPLVAAGALCTTQYWSVADAHGGRVLRDYTATVVAVNDPPYSFLWVNGASMTVRHDVTKYMAHLPAAMLDEKPHRALVICFGMGSTLRSFSTWDTTVTGVDLVPSVPAMFDIFHSDAAQVLNRPGVSVVVDDGRRYLDRTEALYDIITIDPPPPVPAVGSSLLYSREFYQLVRSRLMPRGILAQWNPGGDHATNLAIEASLRDEFPYVAVLDSTFTGGRHYFASRVPLVLPTVERLAERLPEAAKRDLLESNGSRTFTDVVGEVLAQPQRLEHGPMAADIPRITDDHPENEYFLLRRLGLRGMQ